MKGWKLACDSAIVTFPDYSAMQNKQGAIHPRTKHTHK